MKLNIGFLLLLCLFFRAGAQDIKTNTTALRRSGDASANLVAGGLQVGDKLPDLLIKNITGLQIDGRAVNELRLPALRGKILLLDFWASWCAPCRAMIPRLDSLQKRFKKELLVLPVTYESKAVADATLAEVRKAYAFELPEVTGDKVLHGLFPHKYLPHYVWIDAGGVVRAITDMTQVTPLNIKMMIAAAGGTFTLAEKQDVVVSYDKGRPLLLGGNGGDGSSVKFHSLLTGYTEGISGGLNITAYDSLRGQLFTARNQPLVGLANLAYNQQGKLFPRSRVLLLSKDSLSMTTNLSGEPYRDWLKKGHGWCYELMLPPDHQGDPYVLIRQDMDRMFPAYQMGVEIRTVKSLVLVRTDTADRLKSKGGEYKVDIGPFAGHLRNASLSELLLRLNNQYLQNHPLPVADGTSYSGRVDLDLEAPLNNVAAMNKQLAAYGLRFVEKDHPAELLVIRDRITP